MEILLDYELTLQQLLDRYGPPQKFAAVRTGIPERPYVGVALYYPEHGMVLQLELAVDGLDLRPDTEVVRAWYMRPTELEDLLAGLGVAQPDDLVKPLRDWQGYGPIETWQVRDS